MHCIRIYYGSDVIAMSPIYDRCYGGGGGGGITHFRFAQEDFSFQTIV